ncbi:MAG: hypothetical protein JSV16_03165 [Candidatus Hydrogenedentota bacterium]|nr:MAG: hypothetical protein JSV16_03165 [Candidatus Hydrogenedentota bacterium]
MKSGKLNSVLLALVFLALVANLLVPLHRTREAAAVGEDAIPPAVVAAEVAEDLALDKVAGQIADALRQIAESNQQIAVAITQHARSNERIAYSLDRVAVELRSQQANP